MSPFTDVQAAVQYVIEFDGSPEEFSLPVDDLLQDPTGMNMALITDAIFERGWVPDGCEQKMGYRIYRYKEMV